MVWNGSSTSPIHSGDERTRVCSLRTDEVLNSEHPEQINLNSIDDRREDNDYDYEYNS